MEKMKVTHLIFDMDGLLIDTERIYSEVSEKILKPFGHSFSWECKQRQMGKPKREAAQTLVDFYQLPISVEEYMERTSALQRELMPTAELLPGAEKLVNHLHAHQVPMCVATGSTSEMYEIKTQRHKDLFSKFSHILCSDDPGLKRGKPYPDIFELAARRFASPPTSMDKVAVLEDAPNGLEAAKAAGAVVVFVPDARVGAEVRARADLALDSLLDLQPHSLGLPPY